MTEDATLIFIAEVEQYPSIWNPKSKYYKNKDIQDDAWCKISSSFDIPVDKLKSKWISLRGSFRHYNGLVTQSRITGSGAADVLEPTWPYFNAMKFVLGTVDGGSRLTSVSVYLFFTIYLFIYLYIDILIHSTT